MIICIVKLICFSKLDFYRNSYFFLLMQCFLFYLISLLFIIIMNFLPLLLHFLNTKSVHIWISLLFFFYSNQMICFWNVFYINSNYPYISLWSKTDILKYTSCYELLPESLIHLISKLLPCSFFHQIFGDYDWSEAMSSNLQHLPQYTKKSQHCCGQESLNSFFNLISKLSAFSFSHQIFDYLKIEW